LVGFGTSDEAHCSCRLDMNDPPTALVGFGTSDEAHCSCRLDMNDPPTALVGLFRNAHQRAEPGPLAMCVLSRV